MAGRWPKFEADFDHSYDHVTGDVEEVVIDGARLGGVPALRGSLVRITDIDGTLHIKPVTEPGSSILMVSSPRPYAERIGIGDGLFLDNGLWTQQQLGLVDLCRRMPDALLQRHAHRFRNRHAKPTSRSRSVQHATNDPPCGPARAAPYFFLVADLVPPYSCRALYLVP